MRAPSPDRISEQNASLAIATAHAIGALDGAVSRSNVAVFWRERASIVGLAQCLAVAGMPLTPAELFRATVGLADARFVQSLDRGLVSAVVAAALPTLLTGAYTPRLFLKLGGASGLIVGDEWSDLHRPGRGLEASLGSMLATSGADVGTALHRVAGRLFEAMAMTRTHADSGAQWPGWLVAALMPQAIATSGLTARALPCLTGITRSLRYKTTTPAETQRMLFTTLGEQARAGLAMLRRLEACATAWHERLDGVTRRSRAGAGAGLFLVWPALTRQHFADALAVSPAGAAKLLGGLIARDIITTAKFGGRTFYIASESMGEFKLAPRQGRQREAPTLQPLLAELDDAIAAFDLLGLDLTIDERIV